MLSKSRRFLAAAAISMLLTVSFAVPGQRRDAGGQSPVSFSLRAINGPTVTDKSLRGEVVVLVFGASWLPLSRQQLEGVKKFADEYSARGVAVYWVSTDSESPKSKNYASDDQLRALSDKYKVTVLRDPNGEATKQFGVDQIPAIVILDKEGGIAKVIGGFDPASNLSQLLKEPLSRLL
jgi:peroxiredoxin